MPWREESDAVLALTSAARDALERGDLEALGDLLAERGERVARLTGFLPAGRPPAELAAVLDAIAAQENRLAATLNAGLGAARAALSRPLAPAASPDHTGATPAFDRRA